MSILTAFAVYFVIWWITLFAVLPFGHRSQEDAGDITLGTTASAPHQPRFLRKIVQTTIVSLLVFALYYAIVHVMGWSVDSIPRIVPDFSAR